MYLNIFYNIFIMNNNNSNTFINSNDTLFLVNILNTMYNDNLRQINNLSETLNNLNNSNNQIRNLLVQLLNRNQGHGYSRRNEFRRVNTNFNNLSTNMNNRNSSYLIGEYTIPINTNRLFENFFQPVEIYPTQSQIENATRRVRYCDIARPVNTSCPISMDDFDDNDMVTVIRHCGHTFHNEHIMNWFSSNYRCPVCRYDIRDYSSNISNEFFNSYRDSSNNNVDRNDIGTILLNHTFGPGMGMTSNELENLITNNSGIFDASGNYTTNSTDVLTSFFLSLLNRGRNNR